MYKLQFTVVLLFSLAVSAQTIKVKGIIKDSLGNPLELANTIATISKTGIIESYAITNYEGRFQLDLPANETYHIKASFLGYETIQKTLHIPEDSKGVIVDFILKSKASELDGVELVYEMPVTVRGDTIIYNADSFTNGKERKLGDVLEKMPGVEVNAEGEIKINGKKVSKVMVEGKAFFDGDSKLATKNIPADAIDKVEVLKNYNEVNQMRGLGNDQDTVAINIKLKEGKKNFWFGEVTAGAGVTKNEGNYLVHPKLFYYSPKYSLNFITDFNDVGEVPFTWRDYYKFTGGFRNFNSNGGTNFSVDQGGLGFALSQNNRANKINTKFFAGNFSWEASKKWNLNGFAILSDNKTNMVTNTIRNYGISNTQEIKNSDTNQRSQLGMLKLSSVYKPSYNFQFDYDALLKMSKQTEGNNTLSLFNNFTNNISEQKANQPFSINQNVTVYYTLNAKNIFAGKIQYLYQEEDPFYKAATNLLPFSGILPLDENQNRYDINQEKNVTTSKLDAKLEYYYVINDKSNINFTLGSTVSRQRFDSNIFQILDNNNRIYFEETLVLEGEKKSLKNKVKYNFTDVFLGTHYKFKTGKFTFTPGFTVHNYNVENKQLGSVIIQNDWRVSPDFNAILAIGESESIRFNYSISSEYTAINNYAVAYVFSNYNEMFRGNRYLENALSHSYSLNYHNFNMFNYTNISAFLNYSRKINGIKSDTNIEAINQQTDLTNISSSFPDDNFMAYASFSKKIRKIQLRFNTNISYSISNSIINSEITENTNFSQRYKGSVRSNFFDWPNFEIGYEKSINLYAIAAKESTYYTDHSFVNVDINFFKHFTLSADWSYYNYSNKLNTIENKYSFVNVDLYYRESGSNWEFKVQATNILDTAFINKDSFNNQFNATTQYFVLPRIVMLVVKYDL
ncbi:MAG: carboxypeptidase-like regulatory domain-containing protein [Cellulophaga sp.]